VADLKGKKVGVSKLGSTTDFVARLVLAKNDLDPGKDVTLLQLGGVPEIMAGMQSGAVDAGVLSPPTDSRARQAGLKELVNVSQYNVTYYQAPLAAKKSWLAAHRAGAQGSARLPGRCGDDPSGQRADQGNHRQIHQDRGSGCPRGSLPSDS